MFKVSAANVVANVQTLAKAGDRLKKHCPMKT